ncbi:MAG: bifunctional ornithine acetyltransferase/N-acetylglutamate synthase [Halofilum sp. (in: g-proteobacteria)]|nr:bifunctional ornithine acetyltransferase/N-acetylglutamate synthase [Halofilum sp. (in: g-proteobacteria)]
MLPFSTGVIGERLVERVPMEQLGAAIGRCARGLAPDGWGAAAEAILTTDTRPRSRARAVELGGGDARLSPAWPRARA